MNFDGMYHMFVGRSRIFTKSPFFRKKYTVDGTKKRQISLEDPDPKNNHRGHGSPKLNRAHLIMQKMRHCAIKYLLLKKQKKGI